MPRREAPSIREDRSARSPDSDSHAHPEPDMRSPAPACLRGGEPASQNQAKSAKETCEVRAKASGDMRFDQCFSRRPTFCWLSRGQVGLKSLTPFFGKGKRCASAWPKNGISGARGVSSFCRLRCLRLVAATPFHPFGRSFWTTKSRTSCSAVTLITCSGGKNVVSVPSRSSWTRRTRARHRLDCGEGLNNGENGELAWNAAGAA